MGTSVREQGQTGEGFSFGRTGSVLAKVAYAIFWGWLILRWLNNWLLPAGVGAKPSESFIDATLVREVSESLAFAVEFLPSLATGLWITIVLTVISIVLGFVIAVPLSVARVYGNYSSYVSLAYTELIRGTPLLAQLFILYYGLPLTNWIRVLPHVGQGLVPGQAFWVAIIGFTINSAAYQGEYIRSALISIESGQMTAARGLGLTKIQAIRYVILPQGLRYAIPAWSNELVYLIKYSSLASFVTVDELYNVASTIAAENFEYTSIFTLVAILYLGLVISASNLMDRVEETVSIPGLGQDTAR
ncbi:MAG: amino acid ABC transporter permease [Halodesulfurarchaeum sp.]